MYPFVCASLRSCVCFPAFVCASLRSCVCFPAFMCVLPCVHVCACQSSAFSQVCGRAFVCVHMFACICLHAYVCQRVDLRDLSLSVDNSSAGPETFTELLLSLVICHDHWPTGSEQQEVVGGDCSNTENVHGSLLIGNFVADCHLVWVWPQNRVGSSLLVIWDTQK
jgi:hypothetical protein